MKTIIILVQCLSVQAMAWTAWSSWSKCSTTCDHGTMVRSRHCLNGTTCAGVALQQQACHVQQCSRVTVGHWSMWSSWEQCSMSCGLGFSYRNRSCGSLAPHNGGQTCHGEHNEVQTCNLGSCPIDGGWSNFTDRPCSVTCGIGVKVSVRHCDNPTPAHGGKNCEGSATVFHKCEPSCLVDGGWSGWTTYTDCSVVCGDGNRYRLRTCTNPAPLAGGHLCSGHTTESLECHIGPCPLDIKVCDKAQIRSALPQSEQSGIQNNCNSLIDSYTVTESTIVSYCSIPLDNSKWKLGIEIHNNCQLIPLYTPVSAVELHSKRQMYGIMLDCFQNIMKVAQKTCTHNLETITFDLSLTNMTFHMMLFEL